MPILLCITYKHFNGIRYIINTMFLSEFRSSSQMRVIDAPSVCATTKYLRLCHMLTTRARAELRL